MCGSWDATDSVVVAAGAVSSAEDRLATACDSDDNLSMEDNDLLALRAYVDHGDEVGIEGETVADDAVRVAIEEMELNVAEIVAVAA